MRMIEQWRAGSHGIFKAVVLFSDPAGSSDSTALNMGSLDVHQATAPAWCGIDCIYMDGQLNKVVSCPNGIDTNCIGFRLSTF